MNQSCTLVAHSYLFDYSFIIPLGLGVCISRHIYLLIAKYLFIELGTVVYL